MVLFIFVTPTRMNDYIELYHCLHNIEKNIWVNNGGTGVMLFDSSLIKISLDEFKYCGMMDLYISVYAQKNKIPILCRKHNKNELKYIEQEYTLYNQRGEMHYNHIKVLNEIQPWHLYEKNINNDEHFIKFIEYQIINEYEKVKKNIINQFDVNKYDYCININTYNRHIFLKRLLQNIESMSSRYNIRINIFDDGSNYFDENIKIINLFKNVFYYRYNINFGKKYYWMIWDNMLKCNKNIIAEKYIFLPDDVQLKDDFFKKINNLYKKINDDKKICLSILMDENRRNKSCWTNFKVIEYEDFYKTQWNDLCFVCENIFFESLNYTIEKIDTKIFKNKNISSGVGRQISLRLHKLGFSMYHSKISLVIHGDHESKMNKEERIINKLISI